MSRPRPLRGPQRFGPLPRFKAPNYKERYMKQNKAPKMGCNFTYYLTNSLLPSTSTNALISRHNLSILLNKCFTSLLLCNCTNSFIHSQALIVQGGPLTSLLRFLDHTRTKTQGRTPLDECNYTN
jgi:hypothetical protein